MTDQPPVYHVTDRRRDLVRVRLPAGVRLETDRGPGDHLDQVALLTEDGDRLGTARLLPASAARRRGGSQPSWVVDDGPALDSLDDAVEVLLDRLA